jgi:hypothetical protein
VPNILLRDILEGGFCGSYEPKNPVVKNPGKIHYALDQIAAIGSFGQFDQEGARIQAANQNHVAYQDQPFFHKCLEGFLNNSAYFNVIDHEWIQDSIAIPWTDWTVQFIVIRDRSCGAIIEPVYNFVSFPAFVPMHSLIAAYLMGLKEVQIDPISLMSGGLDPKKWAVDAEAIQELLAGWVKSGSTPEERKPGAGCMACARAGCSWKTGFETQVYEWMKAKQKLDEIESGLKEHITYNGPTKVGAHMVYMKENKRRALDPQKRDEFMKLLQEKRPNDWAALMHPDAAEIFKLAAKGHLPKELLAAFKESRYYTLDTTLTL